MRVKVEFTVETPDYGANEFRREIEKLVEDIDPRDTRLIDFDMYEITERGNERDCNADRPRREVE